MPILTPVHSPIERARHSSPRRDTVRMGRAEARRAAVKRLFLCALTVLLATGAVAGIIALKTATYLSRYNYY
jgi:hypothetical protein